MQLKITANVPVPEFDKDENENSDDVRSFYNVYKEIGKKIKSFVICSFDN